MISESHNEQVEHQKSNGSKILGPVKYVKANEIDGGDRNSRNFHVNEIGPLTWDDFDFDVNIDVNDDKSNKPKINDLSKLLYGEEEQLLKTDFVSIISCLNFRATCNQMVCTDHRFQLSFRTLLDDSVISSIVEKIRKTVKYLFRSH